METSKGPEDDVTAFLSIAGSPAIEAFVERHPGLRSTDIIALTMGTARELGLAGRGAQAQDLATRADILVGLDSLPLSAIVIEELMSVKQRLEAGDDVSITDAMKVVETLSNSAFLDRCHPVTASSVREAVATVAELLFDATAEPRHLVAACALWREAATRSLDDRDRARCLHNLGVNLMRTFVLLGNPERLDDGVAAAREAASICSSDDEHRYFYAVCVPSRLATRYHATGNLHDLDEAVRLGRELVESREQLQAEMPRTIGNLARNLADLFQATNDLALLDESIVLARRAIGQLPANSEWSHHVLNVLAGCLGRQYAATANLGSLREAVFTARAALNACPPRDEIRPALLNDLAMPLSDLTVATGELHHLEEAVGLSQTAVAATPPSHRDAGLRLSNLAAVLTELSFATGNRSHLDRAMTLAKEVIETADPGSTSRAGYLHNYSNCLRSAYIFTGDTDLLDQSARTGIEAVMATPATTTDFGVHSNGLAASLRLLARERRDVRYLQQAIEVARNGVAATSPTSTIYAECLDRLAECVDDLWKATDDDALLETALQLRRDAFSASSPRSRHHPVIVNGLASLLGRMCARTGDMQLHSEASELLSTIPQSSPGMTISIGRTGSALARISGDIASAITFLEQSLGAVDAERERLALNPVGLRDLSGQIEGLVSDLAACYAITGEVDRALGLLEAGRTWLPAPNRNDLNFARAAPTVWVLTSRWESVVISTEQSVPIVVEIDARELGRCVSALMDIPDGEIPWQAVDDLCDLATRYLSRIPTIDELLVVPVGLCAFVPFGAARRPDGRCLIERTALTVAPSASWALAASRERPDGAGVGAFHHGSPPLEYLELDEDRRVFRGSFPEASILESPVWSDLAPHLIGDNLVAHFSCHATYNRTRPLASYLDLGEPVTVQTILEHGSAPWLVNLSACKSAAPDHTRSEQMISFPTALILGGAGHVIGTLWSVFDENAREFNRAFYRWITAGSAPATAHQQAVAQLRANPSNRSTSSGGERSDHPYWWAAFTHYGSPRS